MRRKGEEIVWRWDLPIAAGTTLLAVIGAYSATADEAIVSQVWLRTTAYVLLVVASAALLARRRWPTCVTLVGSACAGVYFFVANDNIAAVFPAAIGLYTMASLGYRWRAVAIISCCTVFAIGTAIMLSDEAAQSIQRTGGRTGWMVAVMIAGEVVRHNQAGLRQARDRATAAERAREEHALRRAADERVRIARELHDSLTHSISVINVQAAVALHVLSRQPEQAEQALRHIRESGQDAMRELRGTLKVLRLTDDHAETGIAGLPGLLARSELSGLTVTLDSCGDLAELYELPEEVQAAVYRIVQESLTNVGRHAQANQATVSIECEGSLLRVAITDDGRGGDGFTEGLGIQGMRERVEALGGILELDAPSSGGFQVRVRLPLKVSLVGEAA